MAFAVIKGVAYCLFHAPDLLVTMGTTQRLERLKNPASEYLQQLKANLRSYPEAVSYAPNQVFIGNLWPEELAEMDRPWYNKPVADASPRGRFGDIVSEELLLGLIKFADSFELVCLEKDFQEEIKQKLTATGIFTSADFQDWKEGHTLAEIGHYLETAAAEPLYYQEQLKGCIRRAHDVDEVLNAQVMLENLVAKATGIWALRRLLQNTKTAGTEIDYVIEASEEACGDMNQRGGGNFAKAIGELAGLVNATGADIRSFCSAPAHALLVAAALVKAGIYRQVVVVGGGSVAKLGMNGRDHLKKGLPLLEDVLGAFALLVSADDGRNPVIRTDIVGRHRIGSGATPQAVMEALVVEPLQRAGLKLVDVDRYAPELQNPELTEPAGAGNVPWANYKMIAALAVLRKEIERTELEGFARRHGLPGYAPTQGHIPSGVPFLGFAREGLLEGKYQRVMIIGKGSLFLARLTKLFDGISFLIEPNKAEPGQERPDGGGFRTAMAAALRRVARELQGEEG